MAIRFQCSSCSQPIEVDDEWASRAVACPYCRTTITAPAESTIADLTEIPMASPLTTGQTVPTQVPSPDHLQALSAQHPNRIATVAFALACGELLLLAAMRWILASHRLELEQLMTAMESATGLTEMVEAQNQFFKSRGGVPSWLIALMALEIAAGLNWAAIIVCGIIGARRPNRRKLAITALVVAGLVPIVFCCGGLFLGLGA